MAANASTSDLINWRMQALGLWRPLPGTTGDGTAGTGTATDTTDKIVAVTDAMLALQGQDWVAARWALGLRVAGISEADVVAAFDSGRLVRSWPMRGTIHVLAAEDIGWMQKAMNHRVLNGAAKRRAFLGLDDASLARMTDVAIELLTGGRSASRDELARAWAEAGVTGPNGGEKGIGPWRYHVVWWLCQNGITVPGPVTPLSSPADPVSSTIVPEPRLVLAEEWITSPRQIEGEEALEELAVRFARGRGPVQDRDLAWWTGLTLREVRRGIAAASSAGRLVEIEIDGTVYWAEPGLLDSPLVIAESAASLLLPGFDEHLLGYTDRTAVLDAEHFDRIVPGRNGMFRATVVQDGRVVGTWSRTARAKFTRLEIEAFPGETVDLSRLSGSAETWGAFRSVNIDLTEAAATHR